MVERNEKRGFLGIKMTRRGWNNVLIYVVIGIIIVFWKMFPAQPDATQDLQSGGADPSPSETVVTATDADVPSADDESQRMQLFPEVGIVELAVADLQLQLTQQGWTVNETLADDQRAAQHLVERWQQLEVSVSERTPKGTATEVVVRLEDGRPLLSFMLYQQPQLLLHVQGDENVYRIHQQSFAQLTGANSGL